MLIAIIFVLAVSIVLIWLYNGLVRLNNLAKEGWSGIDVQLKRRYNLIPNLVDIVKGYAQHEKDLFEKVTEARAKITSGDDRQQRGASENMLTQSLKTLFAVAENYPQLKANENFLALQKELAGIEEEIQLARRYYNGTVRDLNIKIESFPSNIVANLLGFKKWDFFELESMAEKEATKINF